uniref:Uncharacterized protein n=1 Tax=Pseudonaja textilis TaxID=8673 RepID=A0A670ZR84_PSETE
MDSRCEQCRKYVRESPPFSLVRITEGEMKSYYTFLRKCAELEEMAQTGMLKSLLPSQISSPRSKFSGNKILKQVFCFVFLYVEKERVGRIRYCLNVKERDVE